MLRVRFESSVINFEGSGLSLLIMLLRVRFEPIICLIRVSFDLVIVIKMSIRFESAYVNFTGSGLSLLIKLLQVGVEPIFACYGSFLTLLLS